MAYRAMLLAAPRASDVAEAQAAGMLALEYALREKRCFATAVELKQGGRVYGLYEAVEPGVEGSRVYRRITGGASSRGQCRLELRGCRRTRQGGYEAARRPGAWSC